MELRTCKETIRMFMDHRDGGFYLSEPNSTELFINPKETYDGAISSGNSVMTYNLVRLHQITEKDEYKELLNNQTTFYVCKNNNCLPPTNEP